MSTDAKYVAPTESANDVKAVIDHAFHGKALDPEVARRVHERAEAIRKNVPLTDIAVKLIREARDNGRHNGLT